MAKRTKEAKEWAAKPTTMTLPLGVWKSVESERAVRRNYTWANNNEL